jgi:hypothetical protein
VLYTAKSKQVRVLPLESYDVLLWFANKYASVPHPIAFALPGVDALAKIQKRAGQLALYLSEEGRAGLEQSLNDLRADIEAQSPETAAAWPKKEKLVVEVLDRFRRETQSPSQEL